MPSPNDKQDNSQAIAKLAAKVMSDRELLSTLSEKVYELMLEDLRHQKERGKN
jgi:hypothetical protein